MPVSSQPEQHIADQRSSGAPARASVTIPATQGLEIPHPEQRPWIRWPWLWFILPALAAYAILFIYPTARAFYLSVFEWSGQGAVGDFIGLQNFRDAFRSDRFWNAATNSLKLFLAVFILQNTVSLGLAVMLNRRTRMTHIYRAIIFLPVVISAIATGVIWVLMLNPQIGVVNPMLTDIGLGSLTQNWQADPNWAMKTVYLVQFWQWNGMAVVLYLAGLQNVPEDLRHAALVDGARRWQVFRDITFPLLAPAFTIVTVLSFILIFRAFDLIYVLTGPQGAPGGKTHVIGVLIYGDAFGVSGYSAMPRLSYAIAEGVTLFVFLAGVSALLIKGLGRREESIR
jgi:raffinose/stachyose/melibiose transport system permease protein